MCRVCGFLSVLTSGICQTVKTRKVTHLYVTGINRTCGFEFLFCFVTIPGWRNNCLKRFWKPAIIFWFLFTKTWKLFVLAGNQIEETERDVNEDANELQAETEDINDEFDSCAATIVVCCDNISGMTTNEKIERWVEEIREKAEEMRRKNNKSVEEIEDDINDILAWMEHKCSSERVVDIWWWFQLKIAFF